MQSESYGSELVYRMLTVNEVAHLLYVHPSTVRRWEKQDGDGYGNFAKVALKGANSERYTG